MPNDRTKLFILAGTALLSSLLLAGRSPCSAQQVTPAGYRPYPLRYATADQVVGQVRAVVAGLDGRTEVLVDPQMNRLLVRGSEQAQRLAAQTLSAIDRPAQAGPPPAAEAQPVVRAYRVDAKDLAAVAADLQRRWPESSNVRIATDARLSQVVVMATPGVHREMGQRLAELTRGNVQATALTSNAGEAVQREVKLHNTTWRELEDGMRQIWGAQLRTSTRENGELATFHLPEVIGYQAKVHIDRRRNVVNIEGPAEEADAWVRVIGALDTRDAGDERTQLLQMHKADPRNVQRAVSLVRSAKAVGDQRVMGIPAGRGRSRWGGDLLAAIFQQADQRGDEASGNQAGGDQPGDDQDGDDQGGGDQAAPDDQPAGQLGGTPVVGVESQEGAFIGNVQIEFIEGLDIIILKGHARDVERVARIIEEIERLTEETQPVVEILHLEYVNSQAMADLITQVYDQILSPRAGQVSITALVNPNALLLIGREDSLQTVINMIHRIDQPTDPAKRLRVFTLRHMSANDAEERLTRFFEEPTGLGTRVRVVADYRSNTIVVEASPRDMDEVAAILKGMDVSESPATQQIKIFSLRNSLATDLAPVLQDAINGQLFNAGRSTLQTVGGQPSGQPGAAQPGTSQISSTSLELITVDAQGGRLLKSGIMFGVTITADANANSLIVKAPAESMELIGALIEQLDQLPSAQSQIKVFQIVNGDATVLTTMLQQLFGQVTATGGAFAGLNQAALQNLVASGEASLVQLRFAVDVRTNSIIVTGSPGDINVVEALLIRLDESQEQKRVTTVYRLKNAPVADVAAALNNFLANQRSVNTALANMFSPYELVEREVVIEPEYISNSLIVSASPRFFESIRQVIEQLDARPPMVAIQVVIAEVTLGDVWEFGVEWGVQDALLFNRGIANDAAGMAPAIRFDFNQSAIGNDNTTTSLDTRNIALGQLLSNLNVGRTSSNAGFGGLVLSVGNDSVNALLRALKQESKLQILSRPQVMTLENQPAFVVVGQEIRLPSGAVANNVAVTQNVQTRNVGIVLGVTPRTTPEGVVVMEIDAEKSSLGNAADGTVIGFSSTGDPITVPPVNLTTTATTVRARSGQTVVLAGLVTKMKTLVERGIPLLKDIPVAGWLFKFDSDVEQRTELLIIMTPYILYEDSDADAIKQVETERMNWSLEQVIEMHGDIGVGPTGGMNGMVPVIYPDLDPALMESLPPEEQLPPQQPREAAPPQGGPQYGLPTPAAGGTPPGSLPPSGSPPSPGSPPSGSPPPSGNSPAPDNPPAPNLGPPTSSRRPKFDQPKPTVSLAPGDYQNVRTGYWQDDGKATPGQRIPAAAPPGFQTPSAFRQPPPGPLTPLEPRPLPPTE